MWNVLSVVTKGGTNVWFGEVTKIKNAIENQIGGQTQVCMTNLSFKLRARIVMNGCHKKYNF